MTLAPSATLPSDKGTALSGLIFLNFVNIFFILYLDFPNCITSALLQVTFLYAPQSLSTPWTLPLCFGCSPRPWIPFRNALISSNILGTYWLGEFLFQCSIFLPFHAVHGVMGFSRQECWSGLPFPSPVDHVLLELSTMTYPAWVALHDMAHSFIELDKPVFHVINLIYFLWLWFSFCLPSDG